MSPAAAKRKAGEPRKVERSDKQQIPISVRNGRIEVQWDCQTRSFTVEDLRTFIEHVDLTTQAKHPFSLEWQDSDGRPFWVRVVDGKLHAAQRVVFGKAAESYQSVSWNLLRRAFQATIAELAKEANKAPRDDT